MMLRHIGWSEADILIQSIESSSQYRYVTYDFERLMKKATLYSGFAKEMIKECEFTTSKF